MTKDVDEPACEEKDDVMGRPDAQRCNGKCTLAANRSEVGTQRRVLATVLPALPPGEQKHDQEVVL